MINGKEWELLGQFLGIKCLYNPIWLTRVIKMLSVTQLEIYSLHRLEMVVLSEQH